MSYVDVGKDAKRAGRTKPSVARKLDPVPEKRPPGAAKPHRKAEKPFGFSYEEQWWWARYVGKEPTWRRHYVWFRTKRQAEQSMRDFTRKWAGDKYFRDIRAETR